MKNFLPNFSNDSATRVFLACLPLSFLAVSPLDALRCSLWVSGVLGATVCFFLSTGFLFPEKFRETALYLWLAVTAQLFFKPLGLHPVLIVSVFLLLPKGLFSETPKSGTVRQSVMRIIFFPLVLVFLGAFYEILGERLRLWSFRLPAGPLLLLSAAAFLWKNQPGRSPEEIPQRRAS